MKRRKPHNVYLSRQSLDILIARKTYAANSLVLPSRCDADALSFCPKLRRRPPARSLDPNQGRIPSSCHHACQNGASHANS